MSIDSPLAKLGGWRFKRYQTRKELMQERDELRVIRTRLQQERQEQEDYIYDLEVKLGIIAELAHPSHEQDV